jgi:hypothetical protein
MTLKPATALTHRRDPEMREETWRIYYGDLHVGTIGKGSGNPPGDQCSWHRGFYPGSDPGDANQRHRDQFRSGSGGVRGRVVGVHLEAHRSRFSGISAAPCIDRVEVCDVGCKLPTQTTDGRARCFCGAEIGIADDAHIYAAHRLL